MTTWRNRLFNISFALNCLLAFLLLFSGRLVVPAWLQVAGRMHPLVLHFPIVIIVLYAMWLLLAKNNSYYRQTAQDLLLLSSFTAVVTALFGLLLSKEQGYDREALQTHQWAGSVTSFLLLAWYFVSSSRQPKWWLNISVSFVLLGVVSIAGDLGADITHGENFLMAPVTPAKEKKSVAFEDALVYADLVQPIFEAKCLSCHNSKKAKGELVMETASLLFKGGKDGKLWDTTLPDLGLMMRRIHLPEDEKEHMPPSGKPQLTSEEIAIIENWIRSGADANRKVMALSEGDTLRTLAVKRLKSSSEAEVYSFAAADEAKIQKLNNSNRVIYRVALNSPALVVNFYNSPYFNSKQLEELSEIGQQVVELNLSKMPVEDHDLKIIARFNNLRILNLNYTPISGTTLDELKKLPSLKTLSLAGTLVDVKHLEPLQSFPKLKVVHAWNTRVDEGWVTRTNQQHKVFFETGFKGDSIKLKLTPPEVLNQEQIFTKPLPVLLKHYINGTTIRYTTDGSDPDSTSSPVFNNDVVVNSGFLLKARAVKRGWYSSDVIQRYFFTTHYIPDSVELLQPADIKYKAQGGRSLTDLIKSDLSMGSGKWLGFRNNQLEAVLLFAKPVHITAVTLSILRDIGGYVFPPTDIEIFGSPDKTNWKLLGRVSPKQPVKDDPNANIPIKVQFPATDVKYIKLVAKPLAKLPKWHGAKGERAWLFIDEVLID